MEAWYSWQCLKRQWQTQVVHVVKQPGINLWPARGHFAIHHSSHEFHDLHDTCCYKTLEQTRAASAHNLFQSDVIHRILVLTSTSLGWRFASQARTDNQQSSTFGVKVGQFSNYHSLSDVDPIMPIQGCSKHLLLQNILWVSFSPAEYHCKFHVSVFSCQVSLYQKLRCHSCCCAVSQGATRQTSNTAKKPRICQSRLSGPVKLQLPSHIDLNLMHHDYTSRAGQAGGGSFKRKNNYKPKKEFAYRMCARRPTSAMPKPSFFVCTSIQPFHGGDVVTCFDVVGCGVRWSNVVGCEVTWGEVMWLVARCHVMSCDVMSCHLMISCVVLCHVMQCDVMWCVLMWWAVFCCEVMRCNGILWVCDAMWLVAMSRCVVRSGCVMWWIGRWSDDPYYKVLFRTTQYYKVLPRTTVLQSINPYYKVLLRTTKY